MQDDEDFGTDVAGLLFAADAGKVSLSYAVPEVKRSVNDSTGHFSCSSFVSFCAKDRPLGPGV